MRRYVRGGEAACTRKPAPKRTEKLDPYKDYIVGRLAAAMPDRIPATVLLREIQARGYTGGISQLKVFVRGLVPLPAPNLWCASRLRNTVQGGHCNGDCGHLVMAA